MSARETEATPPTLTRVLARTLPRCWRRLACLGVHTIALGYGDCAVCGRNWTKGRHWLRFHGTRSPHRRNQPPETTLHVELTPRLTLHRVSGHRRSHYWIVAWRWRGDQHNLLLRPSVSFHYRNLSLEARRERAERVDCVEVDSGEE